MGTVAAPGQVKIDPQGRLRRGGLADLFGRLALVRATGVLDLGRRKLVRRVVLDGGQIEAILSNAREDRFADWLLEQLGDETYEGTRRARELLASAADHPLTAQLALDSRVVREDELPPRLREHALSLLQETDGWQETLYKITPGRLDLGREPRVGLPAVDVALELARQVVAQRSASLPGGLVARSGAAEVLAEAAAATDAERDLVAAAQEPARPGWLLERLGDSERPKGRQVLLALLRAGVLAATPPPSPAAQQAADAASAAPEPSAPGAELDEPELLRWLEAGESERFEELLGVQRGASPQEIRKAYYRTVRRYHPDRFLEGPLARYHERVERCFRLVNEALQVLIDPKAKAERESRKSRPVGPDPRLLASRLMEAARQEAKQGRLTQALGHLEHLVRNHGEGPDHAVPLCLLLLSNPRRRPEAVQMLERLASQHADRADVAAALALAYQKTGSSDRAQPHLDRAARIEPSSPILALARGTPGSQEQASRDPFLAPLAR
jgi:tetratricopeptide (TPR) repeat protein